jgi:hypothetical protein
MFGTSVMADINLNKTCDYYQSLRYTENYPITPACAQQGPAEDSNSGRHMLTPVPPNTMGPADPQNSMLTPVVAGRCILLGSNSGLFLLCKLILRPLTKRLDAVGSTRHPSDL